jgi:hypothetical protein
MELTLVFGVIAASEDFSWLTLTLWIVAAALLFGVVRLYQWAMRRDDEEGDGNAPIWRKYRM